MITCLYKKAFLKDLAKLPLPYRQQIEKLVFKKIPQLDSVFAVPNMKKIKGYQDYYRIRVGDYRIGCEVKEAKRVIFYRVKSRSDIYKLFP
jgi:mRNA interferase RelE/StbE